MQTYILLGRLTGLAWEQQVGFADRDARAEEIIKRSGGKLVALYYTFGQYDFIAIIEAPSEESIAAILLDIGRFGTVNSETLLALRPDQFYKAVEKAGHPLP